MAVIVVSMLSYSATSGESSVTSETVASHVKMGLTESFGGRLKRMVRAKCCQPVRQCEVMGA